MKDFFEVAANTHTADCVSFFVPASELSGGWCCAGKSFVPEAGKLFSVSADWEIAAVFSFLPDKAGIFNCSVGEVSGAGIRKAARKCKEKCRFAVPEQKKLRNCRIFRKSCFLRL